jgi:hypothetical protein
MVCLPQMTNGITKGTYEQNAQFPLAFFSRMTRKKRNDYGKVWKNSAAQSKEGYERAQEWHIKKWT